MLGTLILASALTSQFGYGYTPLPRYDPAGYQRAHPEYIFPYVSGVGNPKVINLQYPKPTGTVLGNNTRTNMLRVRLDDGEVVDVHYGPTTLFQGHGSRVEIDKPNRVLTFTVEGENGSPTQPTRIPRTDGGSRHHQTVTR